MGDLPEDVSRDGIYVFDQGHVGFRLSRAPDVSDAPMSGPLGATASAYMPSRRQLELLALRDSVQEILLLTASRQSGPEHSTTHWCSLTLITNLVNLQWKRDALEKHTSGARARHCQRRQTTHRVHGKEADSAQAQSKQQQQRKPTCTIKWKRPVCMQKDRKVWSVA
ncbi:hypothetical protein DPEC_G00068940 [Dallia pectoralis]|uniref:Uncharacterized protein n=1 Tax=Dallia pectoralis TaxID=75939 RepID=A0ACC2H2B8_DALPE|nr:hypothetical protein DPEC_G00068940 [Dallia pectoralis]